MLEVHMSDTHSAAWEAWIDVGGTFTDCYVRDPSGLITRIKTLSSGKVLATVGQYTGNQLFAPELIRDADGFWVGALVRFFTHSQTLIGTAQVTAFVNGWLTLDSPISDFGTTDRLELDPLIEAPVLAVHRLLRLPLADALPRLRVRLGTTKGTNALLTRRGARTALAITAPFEDLLTIGDQTSPKLFDLAIQKQPPLAELTIGIKEKAVHGRLRSAASR